MEEKEKTEVDEGTKLIRTFFFFHKFSDKSERNPRTQMSHFFGEFNIKSRTLLLTLQISVRKK